MGVGWAYDPRAFACPQPLRTRVLREDPAHVPGTNSGFRVHVLQTHRLEQGLVLVVGRGGARRAWVRRILGERTAHRAARSAPMAWALRARAPTCCPPPVNVRALPLGGGDVEDVVRFALIETLVARRASRSCRGRGWGGVFQTLSCTSVRGNACVLAQHVQCKSARRATATGALYPQARPTSRTLSARARLHAAAVAAS